MSKTLFSFSSACVRPSVDNSAIENAEPASAFSMAEPGNAQTVTYPVLYRFSQSLLTQVQFAFWYLLPSSLIYYFYGQISVCPSVEVLKPRSQLSVCRGSEIQCPFIEVLRARHGRIVSDRHGYPLVMIYFQKINYKLLFFMIYLDFFIWGNLLRL